MSENELRFYPQLPSVSNAAQDRSNTGAPPDRARLEPATCTEAEPFALRVQDDSMQPEFRTGCIIVIDPTGRATDGSYVLADDGTNTDDATEGLVSGNCIRMNKVAGRYTLLMTNTRTSRPRTICAVLSALLCKGQGCGAVTTSATTSEPLPTVCFLSLAVVLPVVQTGVVRTISLRELTVNIPRLNAI